MLAQFCYPLINTRKRLVSMSLGRYSRTQGWIGSKNSIVRKGAGLPTSIDRKDVQELISNGAQLVEVLPHEVYQSEHIRGAINIPLREIDDRAVAELDLSKPVITYCSDSLWDMSERAAVRLEHLGFDDVYRYAGGKADWTAAGLPRGGKSASSLLSGDVVSREVATCHYLDPVSTALEVMRRGDHDRCIVTDDSRVVLGSLSRSEAEDADPKIPAQEVMRPGSTTTRANEPLDELLDRLEGVERDHILISDPDGRLIGDLLVHEARTRWREFQAEAS
jgi:rhodanese-related sulfurtransferase